MRRRSFGTAFALALAATPAGCSRSQTQASPGAPTTAGDTSPAVDGSPNASTTVSLFAAGATQAAVTASVPGFAMQSGLTVDFTFGAVGSLRDRILTGTSGVDVAIVTPAVVAALDAKSLVYPGSRVDLAKVGGGLAVRSGDALPDISDSGKLRAALLAADEIYYADPTLSTAGAAFVAICHTLGIADTCAVAPAGKGHTSASGSILMPAMARSKAAKVVGAAQISEIKAAPGVRLVGQYPSTPVDLRVETVYTAVIVKGTPHLAGAQRLLQFLSGQVFETELGTYGFVPVAAH